MTNEVTIDPVAPGEILNEEFLQPLEISPHRLADDIDGSPQEITEIVRGTRRIGTDTARRLAQHFGTSEKFFRNLQDHYDSEVKDQPSLPRPSGRAARAAKATPSSTASR